MVKTLRSADKTEEDADVVLTTGHKATEQTWNSVIIDENFSPKAETDNAQDYMMISQKKYTTAPLGVQG